MEEPDEVNTDHFLKEVKERAQALSMNATQDTTTWLDNEQNMDTEGDNETQTYLARIRQTGQVTVQISVDAEEKDEALNFASSSVFRTALDFQPQRSKVALAQRRIHKRKKPVTKRWSYAPGDEVVFEIQTTPSNEDNDETIVEGDEDDEEEVPDIQFSKKARFTLLKSTSPGMSLNLLADLSHALKKPRSGEKEVDLPTRPKSMYALGQEENSYSPSIGAQKLLIPTQIQLKTTAGLKVNPASPSISPQSIKSVPLSQLKETRTIPIVPKKIVPSPPRSQFKNGSSTESPSQSPPSKGSPPGVKRVSPRYSSESPFVSLPDSPLTTRVPWSKKPLNDRQDSDSPPLIESPVLPRNVGLNFGGNDLTKIKNTSISPPVAPKFKPVGKKSSSAALVKLAASAKMSEVAKEEKNDEEERQKPAWLMELDRKKLGKAKVETPEKSKISYSIEPEWIVKAQKQAVIEENMDCDSKFDIRQADSRTLTHPCLQNGSDSVETTIRPGIDKKEGENEEKHEEETRRKPAWLQELDKKKQAMAKIKGSEKSRPKSMFEPDFSTDKPDWMTKVKYRDSRGDSMETDDLVFGSEQATVPMEISQDAKVDKIVEVEKHTDMVVQGVNEEKYGEKPQQSSWLEEMEKKRQRRGKKFHDRARPKSMFEPGTVPVEPEWIVKLRKRDAMNENVDENQFETRANQVEPKIEPNEPAAALDLKAERNITVSKTEQLMVTKEEKLSKPTVEAKCETATLFEDHYSNAAVVMEKDDPKTEKRIPPTKMDFAPTIPDKDVETVIDSQDHVTPKIINKAVEQHNQRKLLDDTGAASSDERVPTRPRWRQRQDDCIETERIPPCEMDFEASKVNTSDITDDNIATKSTVDTTTASPNEQERPQWRQRQDDYTEIEKRILSSKMDLVHTKANTSESNISMKNISDDNTAMNLLDSTATSTPDEQVTSLRRWRQNRDSPKSSPKSSPKNERRIPPTEMEFVTTKVNTPESDISLKITSDDNLTTNLSNSSTGDISRSVPKQLPNWAMKARIRSGEYKKIADEYQAKAFESVVTDDKSSGSNSPQKSSRSSSPQKSSRSSSPQKSSGSSSPVKASGSSSPDKSSVASSPEKPFVRRRRGRSLVNEAEKALHKLKQDYPDKTVLDKEIRELAGFSVSSDASHRNIDPQEDRSDSNTISIKTSQEREELPKVMRPKLVRVNSFEERIGKIDFNSSPEEIKSEKNITKGDNDSAKDRNLKNVTEEVKEFKPKKKVLKTKLRSTKSIDASISCTETKIDETSNGKTKQSTACEHSKENGSSFKEPIFPDVLKWSKKIDNSVYTEKKDNNMNSILNNINKSNSRPSSLLIEDAASFTSNGNINSDAGKSKKPIVMLFDKKKSSWSDDLRSIDTGQSKESLVPPVEPQSLVSPTQDKTVWMKDVFEKKSSIDKESKGNSVIPDWKRKLLARKKEGQHTSPVQEAPLQKPKPITPPKPNRPLFTRSTSETSKAAWFQMNRTPSGGSSTDIDNLDFTNSEDPDIKPPSFLEEFRSKKGTRKAHTAPNTRRGSSHSMGNDQHQPEWLVRRRSIIKDMVSEPTSEEWV